MLTVIHKIVCIQCGHKIIGPDVRAGQECPSCHCPMYVDGGAAADFRISKPPVDPTVTRMRLSLQQREQTRRRERGFAIAFCCGLAAGVVFVGSLLWGLSHI